MTSKTNCWLRYSPHEKSDQQIYCLTSLPLNGTGPTVLFQSSVVNIYLLYRTPCTIKWGSNLNFFKKEYLWEHCKMGIPSLWLHVPKHSRKSNHWSESLLFNMVTFLTNWVIFLCSNPFPRVCKVLGKSFKRGDLPQIRGPPRPTWAKWQSSYTVTH